MSEIFFNSAQSNQSSMQSQIENFQTTLASLNQQVIILQERIAEKDQEIADLQMRLIEQSPLDSKISPSDSTLTIVGALIKLYKSVFLPGKVM